MNAVAISVYAVVSDDAANTVIPPDTSGLACVVVAASVATGAAVVVGVASVATGADVVATVVVGVVATVFALSEPHEAPTIVRVAIAVRRSR
jgi:hypothetical protein